MAEFKGQAVRSIRSVHAEILGKPDHILCIIVNWGGKRAGLLQGRKTDKSELYIESWLCVLTFQKESILLGNYNVVQTSVK